ncbi:MAG: hypothetical protein KDJ97_05890 [Anaerolineae bacterium]|nr:hypothetical protein [Anaerolineae bacterium]
MKSEIWQVLPPNQKAWFNKLRTEIKDKYAGQLINVKSLKDWRIVFEDMLAEEQAAGVSIDQERNMQIPDSCPRCGRSMRKYESWRQYAGHNGVCKLAYERFDGDLKAAFDYLKDKENKGNRNKLRRPIYNTNVDLDNFYNDPHNFEAATSAFDWEDWQDEAN